MRSSIEIPPLSRQSAPQAGHITKSTLTPLRNTLPGFSLEDLYQELEVLSGRRLSCISAKKSQTQKDQYLTKVPARKIRTCCLNSRFVEWNIKGFK